MRRLSPSINRSKRLTAGHGTTMSRLPYSLINLLTAGTYTGGAMAVLDYSGTLVSVPADVRAVQGGAWNGSAFTAPVLSDGGYVSAPAITNKVACRKVNPTDTTNINISGLGTKAVVADTTLGTALDKNGNPADLSSICSSGQVYEITSTGAGNGFNILAGQVFNTNAHSISIWVKGTSAGQSAVYLGNSGAGLTAFNTTVWQEISIENTTPALTTDTLQVRVGPNESARYILPALFESSYDMPVPYLSAGVDVLAAVASTETSLQVSTPTDWTVDSIYGEITVNPMVSGQNATILEDKLDANNYVSLTTTATTIVLTRMVGGVPQTATVLYTHAAGSLAQIEFGHDTTNGLSLNVNAVGWNLNADATAAVLGTNDFVGSDSSNAAHFAGYYSNFKTYRNRAEAEMSWGAIA